MCVRYEYLAHACAFAMNMIFDMCTNEHTLQTRMRQLNKQQQALQQGTQLTAPDSKADPQAVTAALLASPLPYYYLTLHLPYVISSCRSDINDAASLEYLDRKEVASKAVCSTYQQDHQARADRLGFGKLFNCELCFSDLNRDLNTSGVMLYYIVYGTHVSTHHT